MTDTELPHIRDLPQVLPGLFARAAVRAEQAGFDGVELHYAHAYTMASFLSALNRRDDGYGGSLAGRVRLPVEVYRAVRAAVSDRFVIGCRFLGEDCVPGGSTAADAAWFGTELARAGMDYLSVSRGGKFEDAKQPRIGWARYPYTGPSGYECMPTVRSDERGPFGRNHEATRTVREAVQAAGLETPVVLAGGISTFEQAEEILRTGGADIVASARQSLADPGLVPQAAAGSGARSAALRLHQLLRGPRPGAQAGDLQALGPRGPRRARRPDYGRRTAAHGGAGVGAGRQVKVAVVGAGPAGLYLAILLKRADPSHRVAVYERNRVEDTFGFGVVFSDETLENVGEADPETNAAMAAAAARWDDIEIHYRGTVLRSTGHRFSGVERKVLLQLLARRAESLGVEIHWQQEIRDLHDGTLPSADLIVAADGAGSLVRDRLADQFQPQLDWRRNRFVWLGSTRPFPAFTFYFKSSPAGLWRTHAYQYAPGRSTFIVEAREETWKASGLGETDEAATVAYLEKLFEQELEGHRLQANRSIWRRFPTVRNARWHAGNVVLLGDAAHTAHFSVGSGTKLAMEDAIALAAALRSGGAVHRLARRI